MLGINAPHPSRGFFTETEFNRLKNACPYADAAEVKEIAAAAASRRRAYKARLRREEKEKGKKIEQR